MFPPTQEQMATRAAKYLLAFSNGDFIYQKMELNEHRLLDSVDDIVQVACHSGRAMRINDGEWS